MDNYINNYLEHRKEKVNILTYKDDKFILGVAKNTLKTKTSRTAK